MYIEVTKLTPVSLAERACEFTTGSPVNIRNMYKMYKSEHSPVRTQMFDIAMYDIPTEASVHFVRHKFGLEHFVKSNREDRGGDAEVNRLSPVNHLMVCNAQALINMARKRLCYKASDSTRLVMEQLVEAMRAIDEPLAKAMVPDCKYRGACHEFLPCLERRSI